MHKPTKLLLLAILLLSLASVAHAEESAGTVHVTYIPTSTTEQIDLAFTLGSFGAVVSLMAFGFVIIKRKHESEEET